MKEQFARWDILLFHYLKRDWKKIIIWVCGLGLFSGGFVPAFQEISKGQGLVGMFETLSNPAMVSMVGSTSAKTAADYTLGAMYAHEMLLFCGLFAMTITLLHVISHTRKEEDLGLTELVRSFQVGRLANSCSVLIESILINCLLALFTGALIISFQAPSMDAAGAFLFGASIGIAGILGGVIALIMAQIMPSSSGATGASLSIMGLLYIVRGSTDISNPHLSMLNPMGWTYLTYPFAENNWHVLGFAICFSILAILLAFALEHGRDMGAGYLPEREGRKAAKRSLLSVPGLFLRLNSGLLSSWLIGFAVLGAAYGSIYGTMQSFLESNEMMKRMFTLSGVSLEASFTATIMMVMVGLVAILPIALVNKLYAEETRLHLSQLYATQITRAQLYWTSIGISFAGGIIGILLAAGGLGASALFSMGDSAPMTILDFIKAGYNLLPSVLFLMGLSALALGWMPKLGKIVYIYLGYSFGLNYFGLVLDLPKWFFNTAVFSWIPRMPVEAFDLTVFSTISAISLALMLLGYIGYQRRDMQEGA